MDLRTMSKKIDSHCYGTFDSFTADFELIISNCLLYNDADSYLHRYALRMHRKVYALQRRCLLYYCDCDSSVTAELNVLYHTEYK